jgi:hypothetical protein
MDRLAIETALGSGTALRTIASQWSVSKTALLRHRDTHARPVPTPLPAEPGGALAQRGSASTSRVESPATPAVADAGAEALTAYQEALAAYDAVRQRDMSGFPGLQAAFMQIQGYQVEIASQRCLEYGIDPARQESARIQQESRA